MALFALYTRYALVESFTGDVFKHQLKGFEYLNTRRSFFLNFLLFRKLLLATFSRIRRNLVKESPIAFFYYHYPVLGYAMVTPFILCMPILSGTVVQTVSP